MSDDKVLGYVRENKDKYPRESIEQQLIQAGATKEQVDAAYKQLESEGASAPQESASQPESQPQEQKPAEAQPQQPDEEEHIGDGSAASQTDESSAPSDENGGQKTSTLVNVISWIAIVASVIFFVLYFFVWGSDGGEAETGLAFSVEHILSDGGVVLRNTGETTVSYSSIKVTGAAGECPESAYDSGTLNPGQTTVVLPNQDCSLEENQKVSATAVFDSGEVSGEYLVQ